MERSVGFIGCGNMGGALLAGWLEAGIIERAGVRVADAYTAEAQAAAHGVVAGTVAEVVAGCTVILLAVKPHQVEAAVAGVSFRPDQLVISVCAGVARERLLAAVAPARVVRVMPNVACRVGAGATLVHGGPSDPADVARTVALFGALGHAEVIADEPLFHVGTALVGSGPAFLFIALEALSDGAVAAGLPRAQALRLAAATMAGAARLAQGGVHPATLKDAVASPGGTTIQGVRALESAGLRSALIEAIWAATARSQALEDA